MDFFDTTPSKSLPSDKKKATTSKSTDETKQVSSVSVDFFTASSGSGTGATAATVTPEKSGGFLRLPKPSKKKTPPRVREDASAAASSRTERISAVSVSTLSRPSQSSRAIPKFGQGTPVSQEKSTLSQDFSVLPLMSVLLVMKWPCLIQLQQCLKQADSPCVCQKLPRRRHHQENGREDPISP